MDDKKRVLDLTVFNARIFRGKFRLRYIFDWAQDYWETGETLSKVILNRKDYEDLRREIVSQNIFVKRSHLSDIETIDAGLGPIELEVKDIKS